MSDLYDALGVGRDATPEEIKAAHRKGVKRHHPDRGGDKSRFFAIQLAYDTLGNERSRKRYDETGQTAEAEVDRAFAALAELVGRMARDMIDSSDNVRTTDFRAEILAGLDGCLAKTLERAVDLESRLERAGKLAKRWKRKKEADGPDLLQVSFAQASRDLAEQIAANKMQLDMWHRAIELVRTYRYDFESAPPPAFAVRPNLRRPGAGSFSFFDTTS